MSSMSGRGAAGKNLQGGAAGGNVIPKGYKLGQIQQYTPEQMGLFKQLFGQVGPDSYLSKLAGGDEEAFSRIEGPQMKQFQELQGQLGSRFSQLAPGAMSAQRGSGFKNSANQATMDFAERLGAQRQGLQRQALQDLLGLSGTLLNAQPYERSLIQKGQGTGSSLFSAALPIGGALLGGALGGPAGAFAGASAGGAASNAFSR